MFTLPLAPGPVRVILRDPVDGALAGDWRFNGGRTLEVDLRSEGLVTVDGAGPTEGGPVPGFIPWPRMTFEVNGESVEVVSGDPDVLRRHYDRPQHQEVGYRLDRYLHAFHRARLAQCRRLLTGVTGRVADVGSGYSLLHLAGEWPFDLVACDRDAGAMRQLAGQGIAAVLATVDAVPLREGAFDAVYAGEIVEHLADPAAALRQWVRLLRPGGRLIVTTPNRRHLMARMSGVERVVNPEHLFEYSPGELTAAVRAAGAHVDRQEGLCLPLPVWLPRRGWRNLVRAADARGWLDGRLLTAWFGATRRLPWICENLAVSATRLA
jgi:SAM-dependent methyltransferase